MTEVISVRFKNRGKCYFFAPNGKKIKIGDSVVVETSKGLEIAECRSGNHMVEDSLVVQPLRPVVRLATSDDMRIAEMNKKREKEAFDICLKKIEEHGLDMKLIDVECSFDGNKTTFFFTSDCRVDFRELVKDLASIFRNRIELRQIGVRDEAKMLGGLGICGRPFCCSRFLDDFQPVSTKMAKVQSMSLNPTKISGSCGRLMCCLRYEQEAYEELIKVVPKQGAFVETPAGYGIVTMVNLLRQQVKVKLDGEGEDTVKTYRAVEVATVPGGRPKDGETPPSVLNYIPEPEEEDEPDDGWDIPELLVNETEQFTAGQDEAPEQPKKNNKRKKHKSGKKPNKPQAEKTAEPAKPAPKKKENGEEKPASKNRPKHKPHDRTKKPQPNEPKQRMAEGKKPAEQKPKQQEAKQKPAANDAKEGAAKKTGSNNKRHYYHHRPKSKQGGEKKQ